MPLGNQKLSISYVFKEAPCCTCVSHHSVLTIQMFQTPALIVMTVAATRMHLSLTDFANTGYDASHFLRSALMLTAADIAVVMRSIPARLGRGARRIQIPNGSSQCPFRRPGWRWPCTSPPRTIRMQIWANVVSMAQIADHRTNLSC